MKSLKAVEIIVIDEYNIWITITTENLLTILSYYNFYNFKLSFFNIYLIFLAIEIL